MLSDIEKKVIAAIQGDIPVTAKPYGALASQAGISEKSFLSVLSELCKGGRSPLRGNPKTSKIRICRKCHGRVAGERIPN